MTLHVKVIKLAGSVDSSAIFSRVSAGVMVGWKDSDMMKGFCWAASSWNRRILMPVMRSLKNGMVSNQDDDDTIKNAIARLVF